MEHHTPINTHEIVAVIQALPVELQQKVADYVDYLRYRYEESEEALTEDYMRLSSESLKKIWDNEEDAVYDKL